GYTPTGPLVADNGFRPETDGFAFENYGTAPEGHQPRVNLGPDEMRKLFGDAVCADAQSGKCDLIPPAQQWMDQSNKGTEGGHAVTPYAVEDAGGGVFNVLIYDNNFPKVTRAIKIDRNANTWSYDAATNPQNPSELYQGDASTKTIDVEPTSPGVGPKSCPFCGNLTAAGGGGK